VYEALSRTLQAARDYHAPGKSSSCLLKMLLKPLKMLLKPLKMLLMPLKMLLKPLKMLFLPL
jgi:hypothetical protein